MNPRPVSKTSAGAALPRAVIVLGLVSLLTDLSSEMIYPLLPLYLTTVLGAGALSLGLIEGVAESTAALVKVYSGVRSDRGGRRKPWVLAGYGFSSLLRPLIGLATTWPLVLLLRFGDRLGKGLRTSPRDALIAEVTRPEQRGYAFGLHRAMDHLGAVLGPLVATALLSLSGVPLSGVFLLAAVPGALVVLTVWLGVREPERPAPPASPARPAEKPSGMGAALRAEWRAQDANFRRLLLALALFTLGNSSDAFLLLHLSGHGVAPGWIAGLWALHHVVKMAAVFLFGRGSDRLGRRSLVLAGWAIYAGVYLGFAQATQPATLVAIFLAYGLYFGCTEPVERAWVGDLAAAGHQGAAYGWYHGALGLTALPASVLFGWLMQRFGPGLAFGTGAALAALAGLVLLGVREERAA